MRKIHCLSPIAKCGTGPFPTDYELTKDVAEADGVLIRSASMHDMDFPEYFLATGRASAGVNSIPLDAYVEADIAVFNAPGANANGVKELVIAGMLMASRNIMGGIEWREVNAGDDNITKDTEKSKKAFIGCEIKGKKLGTAGLGVIGAEVVNATTHLGMEVYGYDPYISVNATWRLSRNVKHIINVDTAFQRCDYITTHVPLLDSTKGMINRERLVMTKDGVVIFDFSRDTLVDDDDMAAALGEGEVRYYVSDFPNPKVADIKNAVPMPHSDASIQESEDNCAVMTAGRMTGYLESGNIKSSVNYPFRDIGICQTEGWMAVLRMNIPSMTGQVIDILTGQGVNISNTINKNRGKYTYTLLDLEYKAEEVIIEKLRAIRGVLRMYVVK